MHSLVHTYSIVAREPETGRLGVAVQSHYFGVGAGVPWAEAGVGAVATQAMSETGYGPRGLELMRTGLSAPDALAALLEADPGRETRQVAMIDAQGRAAVHTGAMCLDWAGHDVGEQYTVQANMMLSEGVVPAMMTAYESATGVLSERLLAALVAAEQAGGDIRGRQSAALLVVQGDPSGQPWNDRLVDLRVEDHPEPLHELERLLRLRHAYMQMDVANAAAMNGDVEAAIQAIKEAERLAPDQMEIKYWHAVGLAMNGRLDVAVPLFERIFAQEPQWAELLRRLPKGNLMTAELVDAVLSQTSAVS